MTIERGDGKTKRGTELAFELSSVSLALRSCVHVPGVWMCVRERVKERERAREGERERKQTAQKEGEKGRDEHRHDLPRTRPFLFHRNVVLTSQHKIVSIALFPRACLARGP
jgi:hypothetical protein